MDKFLLKFLFINFSCDLTRNIAIQNSARSTNYVQYKNMGQKEISSFSQNRDFNLPNKNTKQKIEVLKKYFIYSLLMYIVV